MWIIDLPVKGSWQLDLSWPGGTDRIYLRYLGTVSWPQAVTATASISTLKAGFTRADTCTSVLAGGADRSM